MQESAGRAVLLTCLMDHTMGKRMAQQHTMSTMCRMSRQLHGGRDWRGGVTAAQPAAAHAGRVGGRGCRLRGECTAPQASGCSAGLT